ncbi:Ig-like domain-containing protein [Christiangramia echinicola]|uniref:Ig-like domain (Group 2) n=1 Tax=Christiangramia echinicola TaxID=279359 RepID=A0A1H1NXG6_9FLAO|nr:Ig-like domain-containing protein [Christiangramia echinicola]SDS03637.1 Ig-like domain (group 2) [Christiangramia echinicola]
MRVITLPGRSGPGTTKNDVSWQFFKAGFWTFIKPLAFLLFFFTISSLQAQTTISLSDQVIAKFGVEADLYANLPQISDQDFENSDDWFLNNQWTGTGLNVIAQSGTDSEGNNVGAVISSITSGNNFGEIRMSKPIYSMVDGYLWIDAVYFRDQRTNSNLVDETFFTSGNDKNFEDPILGWTIGTGNGGPQKNDIIEFFGHLRRDDGSPNDNEYAIVGATTRSQSGTSHLDFEYFRKDMVLNAAGTGLEYDPERYGDLEGEELAAFLASLGCNRTYYQFNENYSVNRHGDVVFSVNYESGGDNINVEIFVWILRTGLDVTAFNAADDAPFILSDINGDFEFYPCPTDTNFGYAKIQPKDGGILPVTAQVNQTSILGPPWGSFNSKGQPRDDLPALALVELSLDATELGLDTRSNQGECESPLGSVIVKTRSSAPFTAEQKDLAGPVNLGNTPPVSVELADVDFCESDPEDLMADIMPEDGDYLIEWYLLTGEDLTTRTVKQSQTDINETNPGARSYTPIESGTYEVVVTVILGEDPENLGCFASARVTATIYDDPIADLQTEGVCAGEDAIFTASPNGNGEKYTFWIDANADGIVDGGETILQAESTDNTYDSNTIADGTTVTVLVETTDGCTDYATADAEIYDNPEANLQTDGVCAGEDAIFTASPNGDGEKYIFWLDTNADGIVDGGETVLQAESTDNTYDNNSIADGTTVTVLVKTTDGCTDYATADAEIYDNPIADLQTDGVCAGEDAIFTASPNGDGEKYTFWIDANADGIVDGGETVLQAESIDNTYDSNSIVDGTTVTVLVKTTDGCTDYATADAEIYDNPEADLQTDGVCAGEDAIFTASPNGDGEKYTFWIDANADGIVDGGETVLQAESTDNTYSNSIVDGTTVTVLVKTTNGCTDYATADAEIYDNPEANLETDGVCAGEDAIFTASPNGNGEKYIFWLDTNADGIVDGGETVLQAESTDNTYDSNSIVDGTTVTVLVKTTDGCTDYATADAEIYDNPEANLETEGVCAGEDAIFTATPNGNGEKYTFWIDANADGIVDGGETVLQAESTDNTYDSNSILDGTTVTVLVETTDGCTDYATANAVIYTNPILNGGTICVGDSIDIGIGAGTYESSNNAVATVDNAGLVTGVGAGSVTITYTDGNNCPDTAIVYVENCCSEETAYALGGFNPNVVGFCGGNINSSNWGWSNGPYDLNNLPDDELILYAGAAHCDPANGTPVGTIDLSLDNGYLVVAFDLYDSSNPYFDLGIVHVYAGCTQFPSYAGSPGQYPYPGTSVDGDTAEVRIPVTALSSCGGNFYLIAHTEVDVCEGENPETASIIETTTQSISLSSKAVETSYFSVAPVPFQDNLTVRYEFDYTSDVRIQFFDLNGSLLRTYADKQVSNGDDTQINIDFALRANQVYIVRVETDRDSYSKQLLSGN